MAQLGSALGSGPRGRWFESSHSDHKYGAVPEVLLFGAAPQLSIQAYFFRAVKNSENEFLTAPLIFTF